MFRDDHSSNYDQLQANVFEVGRLAVGYLNLLIGEGMTRTEAMSLVKGWHEAFWNGAYTSGFFDEEWEDLGEDEDDEATDL